MENNIDKIHDKNLNNDESYMINVIAKTPLFNVATKTNERITRIYDVYDYKMEIEGKVLNSNKDLDLFLYLVKQNKMEIKLDIKDILRDLKIINEKSRSSKEKKQIVITSLKKLAGTQITIQHKDILDVQNFGLIDSFKYNEDISDIVTISISKSVKEMYEMDSYKRIINTDELLELTQYEKSLFIFLKSFNFKDKNGNITNTVLINSSKIKDKIAYEKTNKEFNREFKKALQGLKNKKRISRFGFLKNGNVCIKLIVSKKEKLIEDKVILDKEIKEIESKFNTDTEYQPFAGLYNEDDKDIIIKDKSQQEAYNKFKEKEKNDALNAFNKNRNIEK
tara:strand:+ start:229 stop:1236 length:1008 start_codon:yes stop_codon:yes gene_type:complete